MKVFKPKVGVDVDGVLADLITPALKIMEEMLQRSLSMEDLTSWDMDDLLPEDQRDDFWKKVGQARICRTLEPLPGAQAGLKKLQEKAEVYIVTSYLSHGETWVADRDKWLQEHFDVNAKHIIHTKAKHMFGGKMLIDDKPANVADWANEWDHIHSIPVLWNQPYNKDHKFDANVSYKIVRTNDWDHVIDLVRKN